jgi:hypothetical protein
MRKVILIALLALTVLPAAAREADPPPEKNSRAAMGSSVAFPALGQLYTGGRLRTVSVFLLEGWCLSNIVRESADEDLYRRQAARLGDEETWRGWTRDECLAFAESHRERKRDFYWYLAPVLLYSVIDAYVASHLFGFETEDLRPRASLMPVFRENGAAGLQISVSF